MSSRASQDRNKGVEDISARRYARKPITTAIFIFILLFSGIILLSVLPLSFFFDPGSITSKLPIGDFPIGAIIPPELQPQPKIKPEDLPQEFWDILQDLLNNTDIPEDFFENFTIPEDWSLPDDFNWDDFDWGDIPAELLPILGGIFYFGYGPFGPTVRIIEAPYNIPRYWRLMVYDQFDGTNWLPSNQTTESLNFTNPYPSADIHQVRINITLNGSQRMVLPLPILWNKQCILYTPNFNITPTINLTWNLFSNEYKDAMLNMTNIGLTPLNYSIIYNVTYDPNINITYISQNVKSNPPSQGPSLPGKYLQTPNIPAIMPYVQAFLSEMDPFSTTNNTYDTVLAALEYFKTRFYYIPLLPTTGPNITRFLTKDYGDSKDFATAFALFLRYLNISTRYVLGTVGYVPSPPWLPLTNRHYYTEVWIPDNSSGGNWVQFDPSPVPHSMYVGSNPILTRIFDSRLVTDHFDLLFNANVSHSTIQNRLVNNFELTAQLLKNYLPINRTILRSTIKINFNDMTDGLYLGEIQVDNNNQSILITNFTASSTVGPHKFNATWFAVNNATSTVVTCNGSTKLFINYINGTQAAIFTNISLVRGPQINFTISGNLTDDSNNNPVEGQLIEIYLNETNSVITSGYTNRTGEFQLNVSISSNITQGNYHFYANFNGTFIANYPTPYPDISIGPISDSGSNSSEFDIIIFANTSLSKFFNPPNMSIGEDFTVFGWLLFDNTSAFIGQTVNVYEINSSGEIYIDSNTTIAGGFYSVTYFISPDHETDPNPLIKVNTSINDPYVLNSSVVPDPPIIIKVNFTIFNVTPTDPVREMEDVFVSGRVVRKDGYANISNEQISILFNNSPIDIFTTTNETGHFNATFKVPNSVNFGIYTVNATTTYYKYVISKDDTNWNNVTVQPIWINVSISNINPLVAIKQLTDITISGWVKHKDQLFNIANEQILVLLNNSPINIFTSTNGSGYFQTTFRMPSSVNPGNYTINVTTTNFSYGIFQGDSNWEIQVEELWINFSISQVNPLIAIKEITNIDISGRVVQKNQLFEISNEQIAILLNTSPINVFTITNGTGHFSTTFKIPSSVAPGSYIINVTTINSSYTILEDDTNWNIQINPIWINFTILDVTPLLAIKDVTDINISGRVVHKDGLFDISNEQIAILLDNSLINIFTTTNSTGYFSATFKIPNYITPGSYIINATTLNGSYNILDDDTNWNIQIDPIWVNFTISEVTPSEASRGITPVYIKGRVVHKDNLINISNSQISILFNNKSINVFTATNETGHFEITFIVPNTLGGIPLSLGTYIINATTTDPRHLILKDDITKSITINSTTSIHDLHLNYKSFRTNEFIIISGRVTDDLNNEILNYLNNLSVYFNNTLLTPNSKSGTNGNFLINCTIPAVQAAQHYINVTFNGSGLHLPNDITQNINVFTAPRVILSTLTPIAVVGEFIIITGKTFDSNTKLSIMGRRIELRMFNNTIAQLNTDSGGKFIYIIPAIEGIFSFQAYFEGNTADVSKEITILSQTPPENYDYVWIILLIIGIVITLVISGFIYNRKLRIKRFIESIRIKNFETKLKSLLDGKRYKEAIIFLYQIYFSKILEKLKRPPLPGITHRELMTTLVHKIKLDPTLIYPFTSTYEEARYSEHKIDKASYSQNYKLFRKLIRSTFEIEEQIEIEPEPEETEPEPTPESEPEIASTEGNIQL